MITLIVLAAITTILMSILLVSVIIGAGTILIFGDAIVCIVLMVLVMRLIIKDKKK